MNSNAAMRLIHPEPELDFEGTWEICPRTGEHVLSPRSRQLLGIGDGEPVSIQRLLGALHPGDRERWKEAVAEVLDPDGAGECAIEFRTADPVPRWLAASGRTFFEGMRALRVAGTLQEVRPGRQPLAAICRQAVAEALLAHPGRRIELECWDEGPGEWDGGRILQLVRNLLANAIEHGARGEPVVVSVIDCAGEVLLSVANFGGPPIPNLFREHLFDATRRGEWAGNHLGLFIVREIVRAHGGRIELTSDESATAFHVWLPKTGGRS